MGYELTASGMYVPDALLMRHGQTNANKGGYHQDETDPITELGKQQVRSAAENLGKLIGQGIVRLDERPLVVHHGPLDRQKLSCEIALATLAEYGFHPAIVEERSALAERYTEKDADVDDYDPAYRPDGETSHETWYVVRTRLEPYFMEVCEGLAERQLLIVSSGGTLGMLKLLMEYGAEGAGKILNRDSQQGPDDYDPRSSQWYLNKVPNASIDVCSYIGSDGWQTHMRILPDATFRT